MGGYGGGFSCPGIDRYAYNDLSDAQKDELTTLRQKFIDDTYGLRASMMQKHNEVRLLMETSQPDRTELSRLNAEISDIMKQLQENRIDFMLAAKRWLLNSGSAKASAVEAFTKEMAEAIVPNWARDMDRTRFMAAEEAQAAVGINRCRAPDMTQT